MDGFVVVGVFAGAVDVAFGVVDVTCTTSGVTTVASSFTADPDAHPAPTKAIAAVARKRCFIDGDTIAWFYLTPSVFFLVEFLLLTQRRYIDMDGIENAALIPSAIGKTRHTRPDLHPSIIHIHEGRIVPHARTRIRRADVIEECGLSGNRYRFS